MFSPLTMPETVYVQSNASPFVLAHEFGHTYQLGTPSLDTGLGHNSEPANDGWDVREITGIGPKPEGVGYRALMFPEGNNNSDGWITFQEYNELLDQFVEGGSTGSSQSMKIVVKDYFLRRKSLVTCSLSLVLSHFPVNTVCFHSSKVRVSLIQITQVVMTIQLQSFQSLVKSFQGLILMLILLNSAVVVT